MPDRPASAEAQNLSTPTPMGETMPSPVMTGCRFIGRSSPEGRWPTFLPTNPVLTLPGPRPNDQVSQVGRLVEYVNCRDMSRKAPSRREFLTLPLALILAPLIGGRPAGAAPDARKTKYGADISILYGVLTYRLEGTMTETVDRGAGQYEGADDVQQQHYKAELVPFTLKVVPDASTGKTTAHIDLTRFSSWAKQGQPGKITFDTARRLENMSLPMMLGTSVQVRIATG